MAMRFIPWVHSHIPYHYLIVIAIVTDMYQLLAVYLSVGPNHPYSRFTNSTITYNNLPVFKNAFNDLSEPNSVPFPSIPRNLPDLKVTIMDDVWMDMM